MEREEKYTNSCENKNKKLKKINKQEEKLEN